MEQFETSVSTVMSFLNGFHPGLFRNQTGHGCI